MKLLFDSVDIKKAVREGKLKFYVENGFIFCSDLPLNGEKCIVGSADHEED